MLPKAAQLLVAKWRPETPDDHATNLRQLDRWGNELVIPQPYIVCLPAFVNSWNSTSASYVDFATAELSSHWVKRHDWTDVEVLVQASIFYTGAAGRFTMGVSTRFDIPGSAITDHDVCGTYVETMLVGRHVGGVRRITGLRAGPYLSNVISKTSAGTMRTDGNHSGSLRIMEVVPTS